MFAIDFKSIPRLNLEYCDENGFSIATSVPELNKINIGLYVHHHLPTKYQKRISREKYQISHNHIEVSNIDHVDLFVSLPREFNKVLGKSGCFTVCVFVVNEDNHQVLGVAFVGMTTHLKENTTSWCTRFYAPPEFDVEDNLDGPEESGHPLANATWSYPNCAVFYMFVQFGWKQIEQKSF